MKTPDATPVAMATAPPPLSVALLSCTPHSPRPHPPFSTHLPPSTSSSSCSSTLPSQTDRLTRHPSTDTTCNLWTWLICVFCVCVRVCACVRLFAQSASPGRIDATRHETSIRVRLLRRRVGDNITLAPSF